MNDEQIYLDATQEVDSGTQDPARWAKAVALAEGDEEKARHHYIALRVEDRSKADDDFNLKYMPIRLGPGEGFTLTQTLSLRESNSIGRPNLQPARRAPSRARSRRRALSPAASTVPG